MSTPIETAYEIKKIADSKHSLDEDQITKELDCIFIGIKKYAEAGNYECYHSFSAGIHDEEKVEITVRLRQNGFTTVLEDDFSFFSLDANLCGVYVYWRCPNGTICY